MLLLLLLLLLLVVVFLICSINVCLVLYGKAVAIAQSWCLTKPQGDCSVATSGPGSSWIWWLWRAGWRKWVWPWWPEWSMMDTRSQQSWSFSQGYPLVRWCTLPWTITSPLKYPLGNGDPGRRHFLESWILWIAHLWPNAFFRGVLVAIWPDLVEVRGSIF